MKIDNILLLISSELSQLGAKSIVVGGSVRDYFLHIPIKDFDVEVYGLKTLEELERILKSHGKVKYVGKSFGVLKFIYKGEVYDFAFPRREVKVGVGHKGFDVVSDSFMSYEEAAKRRDFTVNAMGYDIESSEFLDPFCGKEDIKNKILAHIDDKTFVEDPLRLYRGVQFCARFGFCMADKTKLLCKQMVEDGSLEELAKERVFDELQKLLLQAPNPSKGFELLDELGVLRYFPQIEDFYRVDKVTSSDIKIKLALLLLDKDSENIEQFLKKLTDEVKLTSEVKALVKAYQKLFAKSKSDTLLRELAVDVKLKDLAILCCDESIADDAKRLGIYEKPLDALLQGRDLIELGLEPSESFSKILKKVYKLQLTDEIKTKKEALEFVKSLKFF